MVVEIQILVRKGTIKNKKVERERERDREREMFGNK
jgi:hypothetical protein